MVIVEWGCGLLSGLFFQIAASLGCWPAPLAFLLGWSSVGSLIFASILEVKHSVSVEQAGYMDTDLVAICRDLSRRIEGGPHPRGPGLPFFDPTM